MHIHNWKNLPFPRKTGAFLMDSEPHPNSARPRSARLAAELPIAQQVLVPSVVVKTPIAIQGANSKLFLPTWTAGCSIRASTRHRQLRPGLNGGSVRSGTRW